MKEVELRQMADTVRGGLADAFVIDPARLDVRGLGLPVTFKTGTTEEPGCDLCREPATRTTGRCTHERHGVSR